MSQSTTSYGRRGTKRSRTGRSYPSSRNTFSLRPYRRLTGNMALNSRATDGRNVLTLVGAVDYGMSTDILKSFSFDTGNVYINGAAAVPIPGATEIAAVYELARVAKIEFTILPSANGLDYSSQTVTTGETNIPYVYHAVDLNDNATPTIAEIRQNSTVKIDQLSKPIRRTVYPRLEGSNGIIDVAQNQKNIFCNTGVSSTQRWHGFKLAIDMTNVVWSYSRVSIQYKIFYEVMHPK